jgi:5-methylcytosine-specific restriction endonuclease McrA
VEDLYQVRQDHPRQHGLPLRGSPEPLALGLDAEWRKTRERILARDGYRCTVHVRPGVRCPETRLLEIHHIDGGDVLLVPDSELRTVCRRHNPRGG